MAKTLDDLVSDVRLMIKDRRTPYRYSDTDVLDRVNNAFRELKRIRPDAYLGCCSDESSEVTLPTYTSADLGLLPATAFPLDEIFFQAIVFHTVGTLELGDDEFAVDNRAMSMLAAFRQMLVGV